MSSGPVLDMQGVVKSYHGLRPLRVASLVVHAGDRVAIEGLDRAAAEVFVNLVNGAYVPDEGDVRVFGVSTSAIETDTAWLASLDRFGIVTERAVLLEGASVAENLALPISLEIDPMPDDVRARVEALARDVDLQPAVLGTRTGEAGPPVRMRVHLARALALGPQVVLMEHPTASLARADVAPFAGLVRQLAEARKLTLVALSADREFADAVAHHTLKLNPGTGVLSSARGWRGWLSRSRK
jgi:ABC-type transporter Mla maintaining outer membrane lipid asymmetry ATPase subunit MlaF